MPAHLPGYIRATMHADKSLAPPILAMASTSEMSPSPHDSAHVGTDQAESVLVACNLQARLPSIGGTFSRAALRQPFMQTPLAAGPSAP